MGDIAEAVATISSALAKAGPWGVVALSFVALVLVYRACLKKDALVYQLAIDQIKASVEMTSTLKELSGSARAGAERETETASSLKQTVETLKKVQDQVASVEKVLVVHCAKDTRS